MSHKAATVDSRSLSHARKKLQALRNTNIDQMQDAIVSYEGFVEEYPEFHEAIFDLGVLYLKEKQFPKAYENFKGALTLQPDRSKYWYFFGKILFKLYHCEGALMAFNRALDLSMNTAQLHSDKASCLVALNQFEEAIASVEKAQEMDKKAIPPLQLKGAIYEMMGEEDLALECYDEILTQSPAEPVVLYRLSDMNRLTEELYDYCDINHKIHHGKRYSWLAVSDIYFAKAIEEGRRKNYDEAFHWYLRANKTIRDCFNFDRDNLTKRTDAHIEVFTDKLFERFKGSGLVTNNPVFIVGMPRSGTTLIEQIISSHPEVRAGGEAPYISRIENSLIMASSEKGNAYPYTLPEIEPSGFSQFAQQYLDHMSRRVSGNTKYITDKMPSNFQDLGLIHMMLPNAKIIHAKRDPVDTCLSCFLKKFTDLDNLSFTFDLEDTGFYFNEYKRLMAHWNSVLPTPILEVNYEEVVSDQARVTREILDFLELGWDDKCLNFHENARGVSTASMHQVRQPIYKSAAGRWKHYEKHIGPLIKMLDQ